MTSVSAIRMHHRSRQTPAMLLVCALLVAAGVARQANAQIGKPLHPTHTVVPLHPAPQPAHTAPAATPPASGPPAASPQQSAAQAPAVTHPAVHPIPAPDPQGSQFSSAPTQPPGPRAGQPNSPPLVTPGHPGQTQQHLSGWIDAHRNMPLAQQQRALENEPGFHALPAAEQERIHQRLTQLNAMPPQQRQKVIERAETMERLAPAQRQQVRNAMAQLGSLPEDRRHAVSRAFYQLRDMPLQQRQNFMNSPQFHNQFNDQERFTISSLLTVTPISPPLQAQAAQPR